MPFMYINKCIYKITHGHGYVSVSSRSGISLLCTQSQRSFINKRQMQQLLTLLKDRLKYIVKM